MNPYAVPNGTKKRTAPVNEPVVGGLCHRLSLIVYDVRGPEDWNSETGSETSLLEWQWEEIIMCSTFDMTEKSLRFPVSM